MFILRVPVYTFVEKFQPHKFFTFHHTTSLGLYQGEMSAYDRINDTKTIEFEFDRDVKHCRKRKKSWLPAFSLPTVFSNALFTTVVKVGIVC